MSHHCALSLVPFAGLAFFAASALARPAVADDGREAREGEEETKPLEGKFALTSRRPKPFRPMGMIEVGVGVLTLPAADLCALPNARCTEGDGSLMLAAWQLYRPHERVSFGAGITLGLATTTDPPRSDPAGLPRDHTRRYMTVEAVGRYFFVAAPEFEFWGGLTTGLVVVSDSFLTNRGINETAVVGPRGVTIRTEGFAVSGAMGAGWALTSTVFVGGGLRFGSWFLPTEAETNPIGDAASLTSRNTVFDVTLTAAYRLPF